MNHEEMLAMMEEVMDLDEGTLQMDSALAEFEEWDSLSALSLIAVAKQKFHKVLTADDIKAFQTVQDICAALSE